MSLEMFNSRLNLYAGTSGLVLPVPNKSYYPPAFRDSSRLTYYASLHNSIEINSTFYRLPKPKTISKWAQEVPENFRFTFKLWKAITHVPKLNFDPASIFSFFEAVNNVNSKKGCILIQFPASIKIAQLASLRKLLEELALSCGSWPLAVEFRDPSLYNRQVIELLDDLKISLVLHDKEKGSKSTLLTASETVYIRFHGPSGNYRGDYDEAFLQEYSLYMQDWIDSGKTVFTYFNNTMGNAHQNLVTLERLLRTSLRS